jgi:ERCC4-type nuclease
MLRGTLASLFVGYGIPVLRTASVEETSEWIDDFARREQRRLARRFAADRPEAERTAIEMLAAIPGVGRWRAERLIEAAGPVAAVLSADERSLRGIPGIGRVTARRVRAAGAAPPRPPGSAGDGR